jgi:hypothetical protein
MNTPTYHHIERCRPGRLFYFLAGIFCAFALGIIAPQGFVLIAGVILCGVLLWIGAPAIVGGATWESWIHRGRVHWVRPGRLWGHWNSCPVEDVIEFRPADSATHPPGGSTHVLILKDGSERKIDRQSIGDTNLFLQALQNENPKIRGRPPAQPVA